MSKQVERPRQLGRLMAEGATCAKFWIRAFGLEDQIAFVQGKINAKAERKVAAAPIISEYTVDPELLIFCYALNFTADQLGASDVLGMVFFSDKENLARALEQRDRLADTMMKVTQERKWDETLEAFEIEPGKEQ
jgi:hypothetical protein